MQPRLEERRLELEEHDDDTILEHDRLLTQNEIELRRLQLEEQKEMRRLQMEEDRAARRALEKQQSDLMKFIL